MIRLETDSIAHANVYPDLKTMPTRGGVDPTYPKLLGPMRVEAEARAKMINCHLTAIKRLGSRARYFQTYAI